MRPYAHDESFPVAQPGEATPEAISDLIYQSFYYSQGSGLLQEDMLTYGQRYYRDALHNMHEYELTEAANKTIWRADTWLKKGPHPEEQRSATLPAIAEQVYENTEVIMHPPGPTVINQYLDEKVAASVVRRDYRWIVHEPAGRQNRTGDPSSEYNDPFLSHAIHYGLLANSTRNPVFDAMYKRVGTAMLRLYQVRPPLPVALKDVGMLDDGEAPIYKTYNEYLDAVVSVYAAHHPGKADKVSEMLLGPTAK